MMSEAELHQIRVRLHQGERQKAACGELRLPLPAGLAYDRTGAITLHPDEEVQGRLRLVLAKFRELKSAKAVIRYLQKNQLLVPARPLLGPAPQEIVWRPADSARVLDILKNPTYAGAYGYGSHRLDPTRRRADHPKSGTVRVAREDWPVCLREAHPGYIRLDEFLANQQQLTESVDHYEVNHHGVPRQGSALLQSIVVCGCCPLYGDALLGTER
jgi:Recombinase